MTTRRKFLKTVLAAPAMTFAHWSPFASSAFAADKEPFSYGVVLPLTGAAAPFGTDQVKAHMWAVEEINAAGGANGRKLNPIVLDSQAKPDVGVAAVTRLASVDKVPMFVTAFSAVVAAVAPIANRNKILELSVGANSPRISKLGEYVYTTYPLADVDVTLLAKYAYEKLAEALASSSTTRVASTARRFSAMRSRSLAATLVHSNLTKRTRPTTQVRC
jgi:branched-chain amino acid transport system substrate-binding protein